MISEEYKHISVDDLRTNGVLSVRAANCCEREGLMTLYDVLSYYKGNGTFLNVRNSGKKTNLELSELCDECLDGTDGNCLDTIFLIDKKKKAPKRTYEHKDLSESVSDYHEFEELILKKTREQKDLNENVSDYHEFEELIEALFPAIKERKENDLEEMVDPHAKRTKGEILLQNLTKQQKLFLVKKYNDLKNTLSNRAQIRLTDICFDLFVKDFLLSPNNSFLSIRHVGERLLPELIRFKNDLIKVFKKILVLSEVELSELIFKKGKADLFIDEFTDKFYSNYKHFPMFRIVEHYIKTSTYRDTQILMRSLPLFKDVDVEQRSDIAEDMNLTRERVRQIRNRAFQQSFDWNYEKKPRSENSKLIKQLISNKEDWAYIEDIIKENYLISGESDIKEILALEQSNLTEQFALHIIKCVFKDLVTLFNGLSIARENVQWKNTYLIPSYLTDAYDFQKGKVYFEKDLAENEEEEDFNIKTYVTTSSNWIKYDVLYEKQVVRLIRDILINEFDIFPSDEDQVCVVIPAMKEKHPSDIVYEILKANGEPMYLDEIFEEFKIRLPHHRYSNPEHLRSSVWSNDKITHISRESLYTLKEWTDVRTGTIRDAVLEFLEKSDIPQDFDSITEYVVQFFPRTYKESIRSSLKQDRSNRFVFFKNDLVGLKLKKYPVEYEDNEDSTGERKSVEQRITELEKFIVRNQRFPYRNSQDSDETSLYRWYNRVCDGVLELTEKQDAEVKRIIESYAHLKVSQSEYNWNMVYDEYLSFLSTYNRVPTGNDVDGELDEWYQDTLNLHRSYQLNRNQTKKLIQLMIERDNVTR